MFIGYLPYGAEDIFLEKLQMAGCHQIIKESEAGSNAGLMRLIDSLNEGDVLILCHSSHAGTELDFLNVLIRVGCKCAHFVSIDQDLDTLRDTTFHCAEASH
ncbi:hypothetical protein SAMN04487996_10134 [Dyadobacter soli]|uniref:Resolvase, N terminal domain n=1 Tax=Dyadobacter soli TaxID=659014 RepID=A0A1G6USK3_9BACT|nr:hypothetical protein [Dyadobacter soli]SDD43547.1 hypothetical protein SAMN04487996_10134 [Dyadobacter soli]